MKLARIMLVLVLAVTGIAWWALESGEPELDARTKAATPAAGEAGLSAVEHEELATEPVANSVADPKPATTAAPAIVAPTMVESVPLCAVHGCVRDGRTNESILTGRTLDPRMMVRFTRQGERTQKALLGEDGCYASVLLKPGAWTARAMVPGTWRQERRLEIPDGQSDMRLDFVLAVKADLHWRAVIESALSSDAVPYGKEVPPSLLRTEVESSIAANVRVVSQGPGGRAPPSERDDSTVEEVWGGAETVHPTADGDDLVLGGVLHANDASPPFEVALLFDQRSIERRTVEDPEQPIEFRVHASALFADRGGLHLRVVDPRTHGPKHASLWLENGEGSHSTTVDGDAWFPLLEAGAYVGRLRAGESLHALVSFSIHPGRLTDLGEIVFAQPGRVEVRTSAAVGRNDLFLQVVSRDALEARPSRIVHIASSRCDDRGVLVIDSVPAGRFVLRRDEA